MNASSHRAAPEVLNAFIESRTLVDGVIQEISRYCSDDEALELQDDRVRELDAKRLARLAETSRPHLQRIEELRGQIDSVQEEISALPPDSEQTAQLTMHALELATEEMREAVAFAQIANDSLGCWLPGNPIKLSTKINTNRIGST